MVRLQCTRCKRMFVDPDEYEAERRYNDHECRVNGRTLDDLTMEELLLIITEEKTEAQVWDERKGG